MNEEKDIQSAGLNALDQQPTEQPQQEEMIPAWPSVDEGGNPVAEQEILVEETQSLEQTEQPVAQQEPVQQEARQEAPRQETAKEYNIRLIREEREQYQRERDELARRLAEYEKSQQKQEPEQEENLIDVGESDLVEGKHLTKMGRELKNIKQQLAQYQQTAQVNAIEQQVRTSYPDFDKVVTPQAIEELKKRYPAVAATIYQSNDLYNKAASAYDLIKSLGIHKDPVKFEADKAKIEQNLQKPRVAASVKPSTGANPLDYANDFANGLTDEAKERLNREMAEYSRLG